MTTADRTMSTVKRWIALGALGLVAIALLAVLGLASLAVRETGSGSNPDTAFSATELLPDALAVPLTWLPDRDGLARSVEPATREQLGATWRRANDALGRAAAGDTTGLEIWFTGAALDTARRRFDTAADVSIDVAMSHELQVDFYSLDGQVVVMDVDSTVRRAPGPDGRSDERVEAILVLADGNWRIRNLERVEPGADGSEF